MITGKIGCDIDNGEVQELYFVVNSSCIWERFKAPGSKTWNLGLVLADECVKYSDLFVLDKELTVGQWVDLTTGKTVDDIAEVLGIDRYVRYTQMIKDLENAYEKCTGQCDACPLIQFCEAAGTGIKNWGGGPMVELHTVEDRLEEELEEKIDEQI